MTHAVYAVGLSPLEDQSSCLPGMSRHSSMSRSTQRSKQCIVSNYLSKVLCSAFAQLLLARQTQYVAPHLAVREG